MLSASSSDQTDDGDASTISKPREPADFPSAFCADFYRRSNPDLEGMDAAALWNHYDARGREEGRLASPAALRENFVAALGGHPRSLEIGPFDCPVLKGDGVRYFDIVDSEELRRRALYYDRRGNDVPDRIHYVSPSGDLSIVDERFSLVFSSHAIEHQTDLVAHLQNVERLLVPGGIYATIVPNCAYCFDHFLGPSSLSEVVEAHEERRTRHALSNVIDHYAYTTHNDAERHWRGDHGTFDSGHQKSRIEKALEAWRKSEDYIDVHAWQFVPRTFEDLINRLADLSYFNLRPIRVYDTPRGQLEFCAVLACPEIG